MAMTEGYVHVLNGRLRIRMTQVKRSAAKAAAVETMLRDVPGVTEAQVNPLTGSVLVFFDARVLTPQAILGTLNAVKSVGPAWAPRRETGTSGVAERLSNALVRSIAEFALERMVVVLL